MNYIDPYGLYAYDVDGNIRITNPNEIANFFSSFGQNGVNSSINSMRNYITQNFALDLPEVTVFGNSQASYDNAGRKVSRYQKEALEKAKLDDSVCYGEDVYSSDYMADRAAATLPGIGIFINKNQITDLDLLMHEYGHILQAKKYGSWFYYTKIVPTSLLSAYRNNNERNYYHSDTWTEWSANDLSNNFFRPQEWNAKKFPLLPVRFRSGIYPPMNPLDFYSRK